MKSEIAQYIANCNVCRHVKAEHQRPAGTLQPLAIPEWKWDKISMDFITRFPRSKRGNNAIFVVIDHLSKVSHFLPVRESITASQLADLYISRIVSLHGVPLKLTQTVGVSSPLNFGKVSKMLWELVSPLVPPSIPNQVVK